MNAETTTCISIENEKLIKQICKKYKMPITSFVVLMVKFASENRKLSVTTNRNVKYREKGATIWKRIHLQLRPNEYEFLMDVKKIWKMSVAKMIEYCIENVLFDLVDKVLEKNKTDNYLYNNYHFEIGEEDGIIYCYICWGLPQKILQKLIQPPPVRTIIT